MKTYGILKVLYFILPEYLVNVLYIYASGGPCNPHLGRQRGHSSPLYIYTSKTHELGS